LKFREFVPRSGIEPIPCQARSGLKLVKISTAPNHRKPGPTPHGKVVAVREHGDCRCQENSSTRGARLKGSLCGRDVGAPDETRFKSLNRLQAFLMLLDGFDVSLKRALRGSRKASRHDENAATAPLVERNWDSGYRLCSEILDRHDGHAIMLLAASLRAEFRCSSSNGSVSIYLTQIRTLEIDILKQYSQAFKVVLRCVTCTFFKRVEPNRLLITMMSKSKFLKAAAHMRTLQ